MAPLMLVRVNTFPGGHNWPLFAARDLGFFAESRIRTEVSATKSSIDQMSGLLRGDFDIAMTAFDNVVAYQNGQGAFKPDARPDFFAFIGLDNGFLRLLAQPHIESVACLRGQQLAVDAPSTGYAFVLKEVLAKSSLDSDDYQLVSVGGMLQRWNAMLEGRYAATLVLTPFDILGRRSGLRCLADASAFIGSYLGGVGAARRSWAEKNSGLLVQFIEAYLRALHWLFDNWSDRGAIDVLVRNTPGLTPDIARQAGSVFFDELHGFHRYGELPSEGIATTLAFRKKYVASETDLVAASYYVDTTYLAKAVETMHMR